MITCANPDTTHLVREMWKTCFGDTDEYIDLLFTKKYKEENTLIYFENGNAVASLQMLPYNINLYGESTPFYYLAGLCTLPDHRRKGYMEQLILRSFDIMKCRDIPLAILVPAEDWLFDFYAKYGFQQISDKSKHPIPSIKKILESTSNIKEAYEIFDKTFNKFDFSIQKDFEDFKIVVEDLAQENFPDKYNLATMARIIDIKEILRIYAIKNKFAHFTVKVGNYSIYHIQNGVAELTHKSNWDFEVNIQLLCRLLFGYKTDELKEEFRSLFPSYKVSINLMLE